jgi:hypothetical protein
MRFTLQNRYRFDSLLLWPGLWSRWRYGRYLGGFSCATKAMGENTPNSALLTDALRLQLRCAHRAAKREL